jgi:hypothetical protein
MNLLEMKRMTTTTIIKLRKTALITMMDLASDVGFRKLGLTPDGGAAAGTFMSDAPPIGSEVARAGSHTYNMSNIETIAKRLAFLDNAA